MTSSLSDFNSIKVRLEPSEEEARNWTMEFQFHKGAIRTRQTRL